MPAGRHAPARKRFFHYAAGGQPVHGHWAELAIEISAFLSSVMFVVGSICFLSTLPVWANELGAILFIVASVVYVLISSHSMREIGYAKGHGVVGKHEYMENLSYLVAAIIFAVGTILFWPGIYPTEDLEFLGEAIASWCFIVGSFGFVAATWLNSLSLSYNHLKRDQHLPNAKAIHRLSAWALFFSMCGGVFFVAGSWLYRPSLQTDCKSEGEGRPTETREQCIVTMDEGSRLYILGSLCYTVQSVLNLLKLSFRVRGTRCEWLTGDEDGELNGAESEDTSGSEVGFE